jgi:hypothetical protein
MECLIEKGVKYAVHEVRRKFFLLNPALELIGDELERPLALDFLQRWPDVASLKTARDDAALILSRTRRQA